jgi:hypothetical protein
VLVVDRVQAVVLAYETGLVTPRPDVGDPPDHPLGDADGPPGGTRQTRPPALPTVSVTTGSAGDIDPPSVHRMVDALISPWPDDTEPGAAYGARVTRR